MVEVGDDKVVDLSKLHVSMSFFNLYIYIYIYISSLLL